MASQVPCAVEPRTLGAYRVVAFVGEGRRANVWWAESDTGPIALRLPHQAAARPELDAAQRRAWRAGCRRGDLTPEGVVEPPVRGDHLGHLIEGARGNGPIDEVALGALGHGIFLALTELPDGHGDLVPHHVLVGEAGTVRLIDADPERFREAHQRPGRAAHLPPDSRTPIASDRASVVGALKALWAGGRAEIEEPPAWLAPLASVPGPDEALEAIERQFGRQAPTALAAARARLLDRLCPERRSAWAAALPRETNSQPPTAVEPAESREPTQIDSVSWADSMPPSSPIVSSPIVEPPSLGLPTEAVVPTQIVRRRSRRPPSQPPEAAPLGAVAWRGQLEAALEASTSDVDLGPEPAVERAKSLPPRAPSPRRSTSSGAHERADASVRPSSPPPPPPSTSSERPSPAPAGRAPSKTALPRARSATRDIVERSASGTAERARPRAVPLRATSRPGPPTPPGARSAPEEVSMVSRVDDAELRRLRSEGRLAAVLGVATLGCAGLVGALLAHELGWWPLS